ncbi:hypothetical protein [Algibacter luteus]|uniref:Uncharacterized protein n=1 Tax=Algibacter luteus TaxID=1178825 RepID=A0A1M6BTV3_9FLAO|nr:hypothetical protein [Algibacter luteus]WJJ95646.1 hypothetical protein O5O44_10460 [Algibacter luteus]SHI52176.1 hypothetical protein SAMN05216261_0904 [Algibacter luteus]
MKVKIILFSISLFLFTGIGFAQKKKLPKSFISEKTSIGKYHNKGELDRMQKGELIALYSERVQVLVKTLPYVAFATKPGVTMATLGIPTSNDNKKALDGQFESTDNYLENTNEFHKEYLPYSDTGNLIAGILFYEEIMKSLHQYNDFR